MMELYAIDVFVDLLRRYGDASPMDEYAFSDERVMLIGKQMAVDHNIQRYQLAKGLWLKMSGASISHCGA
jgi:hypothetical protein